MKFKKQYDFIFSIGAACSCTQILRRAGLQTASYPLDWVAGVPFLGRIDFITNGFRDYFNKEDLMFTGQGNGAKDHPCDVYKNKRTGMIFNHDFSEGADFEKTYPIVKAKYDRRTARLYGEIKKSGRKVLIVYVETPDAKNKLSDTSVLMTALEKVHGCFPEVRTDLLYCSCSRTETLTHFDTAAGGIDFWRFDYGDERHPVSFAVRLSDAARKVKSTYRLKMTPFQRLANFIWLKKAKLTKHFLKRKLKKQKAKLFT